MAAGTGVSDGVAYELLEYIAGGTLDECARDRCRKPRLSASSRNSPMHSTASAASLELLNLTEEIVIQIQGGWYRSEDLQLGPRHAAIPDGEPGRPRKSFRFCFNRDLVPRDKNVRLPKKEDRKPKVKAFHRQSDSNNGAVSDWPQLHALPAKDPPLGCFRSSKGDGEHAPVTSNQPDRNQSRDHGERTSNRDDQVHDPILPFWKPWSH